MINNKVLKPKSAYTLIELSIVILMVSVLMMGGLTITISSLNKAKKISTQNKINEIYNALGKFLLENKRLPCPASITLTKDDNLYGFESRTDAGCSVSIFNGNLYYGMVPAKTLNLALNMAEDDFGSKISFIIDQRFTTNFQDVISNKTTGFGTTESYTGIMSIKEKPSSVSRTITDDAILVILSHGLNKMGAFNHNATIQNDRSSDSDEAENDANEAENDANNFNNIFIYNSQNSKIFDDVMIFKTRNQIVQDFNAFYLIACLDDGSVNPFSGKSVYYGQNLYGTKCSGAEFTYDKIPEKYCDRLGRWHEINRCGSWL